MVLPGIEAVRGASLGGKVVNATLTGGAMGGTYGFGSGEGGPVNRAMSAAEGGLAGATLGAVVPLAGAGIRGVAQALRGAGTSSKAVQMVADAMTRDGMTPADVTARLNELGPDAMIADTGPNLQRQAGALASTPSRGQQIVRDALLQRSEGANARIQGDTNTILGPAPIPSQVDAGIKASQRALGPEYDAALQGAKAVDTKPLADTLDSQIVALRGDAQAAIEKVRPMLNIKGTDVLDPNPATLHQTRMAIDDMITPTTPDNVKRVLTNARQQIDAELTANVPGIKAVDAKYAELARQREALVRGQTVLDSGRDAPRPAELAAEMTAGAQPRGSMVGPSAVPYRLSQGARAEIDRIIGTKGNDVVALNGVIKGDGSWNRDRLATLFGQDKADKIINVVDRERTFANSTETIIGKPETAARIAAQRELSPAASGPGVVRSLLNFKPGDAAARLVDKVGGGMATARQNAIHEEIAQLLSRQGPQVSQAVAAVARALRQRAAAHGIETGVNRLLTPVSRAAVPQVLQLNRR
jgi:hypothetical protein